MSLSTPSGRVVRALALGVAAQAKDRDEPTLHLLLGHLYDKLGLPEQAAADEEAQFLSTRGRIE